MNKSQKGSKKFVAVVLVILISILTCQIIAIAETGDNPLFLLYHGGSQGVFDETIEAGSSGTITFSLKNADEVDNRTNAILVYDAITNTNGGNRIMSPVNYTRDLMAGWFEFKQELITLAPQEMVSRELTFTVPIGTPPGNYCAILAMYNAEADDAVEQVDEEKNIGIKINQAITQTTAIVIRVPGNYQRAMHLEENFRHDYGNVKGNLVLSVPFSNDSTAYDFPNFDVMIFDSNNSVRYQSSRKLPIVYADSLTKYLFDISSADLEAGIYTVNVVMTYGNGEFDGRDEKTYILDLSVEDVEIAKEAEEKHELRTADLDFEGFFVFDKDKIVMYLLIGGGSLLLLILLIILIIKRPKRKKGRRSKNNRKRKVSYQADNEDTIEVSTRRRGNHSKD